MKPNTYMQDQMNIGMCSEQIVRDKTLQLNDLGDVWNKMNTSLTRNKRFGRQAAKSLNKNIKEYRKLSNLINKNQQDGKIAAQAGLKERKFGKNTYIS